MRHFIGPVVAALLSACGDTSTGTTDAATGSDSSEGGASSEPMGAAAVTYYRDIKPLLAARCNDCHSPGNIAPFSLVSYEEAKMWAPTLVAATAAGTMPPWPPDNRCNTYTHDRSLSAEQQRLLADWSDLGAPAGDPADEPPAPEGPQAIAYDVQMQLPVAYTPVQAPDEYRCFILDWPADQPRYVTGFAAKPGEPAIVHHVIAFIAPPAQVAAYQALDDADPDPGYLCFGGPGGSERPQWLGAWVPGSDNGALPEGTGVRVEPGSKIVVQMHYHTLPGAGPDRSSLAVRTADSVDREAFVVPFADPGWISNKTPMEIPAGADEVTHQFDLDLSKVIPFVLPDSGLGSGDPLVVHTAALHMHTRGVFGSITVERADGGTECMLEIPRWDFNWQGSYALAKPVTLRLGDRLKLACTWDNANNDQDVFWGEGTADEMCLGVVYVTGE